MPRLDPSNAECTVFTFKEGLLSPVAHDLKLEVGAFAVDVGEDHGHLRATFEANSLTVACAMKDGVEAPGTLSARDKEKIRTSIAREVLEVRRYPSITFTSEAIAPDGDGYRVEGKLNLHGVLRPLTVFARRFGRRLICEARLHQPDFGIKPYTAMFGTLKVAPDVMVRLAVEAAAVDPSVDAEV